MFKPFVLVFPGQGSQKVGMGKDLFENSNIARQVFEEVDDSLNQKLSKIIFDGEEEDLKNTANTQPALMAVSIAILRTIEQELGKKITDFVEIVLGHSLGEYSALCGIQSIDLGSTAKILRTRGNAMQNTVKGVQTRMVAVIGLDVQEIEDRIKKKFKNEENLCEIANDNCPGQVILSGTKKGVDFISEELRNLGARSIIDLNVSAPFHCSLMKPASRIMAKSLERINLRQPQTGFISNVSADFENDPEKIKKLLVDQVHSRVKWRESINKISNYKIKSVVEIGSGKVLTGLNKRIGIKTDCKNVSDLVGIKKFIEDYKDLL